MAQSTCDKPVSGMGVSSVGWKRWPRAFATPTGLAWLGFVLSLVFLFCRLGFCNPRDLNNIWLSSDTLYPVNVFTDTVIDGYSLSGWKFSIAPCWFPDLFLAGLFLALTQNVILATLFAGFIQIALIVGAFVLIRRAVRMAHPITQDVFLLAAGMGITLFVANRPNLYYPALYQFFIPQSHVGSLCVVLYGLGLALLCVRRVYEFGAVPKRLMIIYAVVCTLGGMSNLLFIVQMLAPLTVSLGLAIMFSVLPIRTSFVSLGLGWSAAATGAVLNRVLFDTTSLSKQSAINYESVMVSLDIFVRGYVAKLLARDHLHILAVMWMLVGAFYVLHILRIATKDSTRVLSLSQRMTVIFFLSCPLSAIFSAGAIILGGSNGLAVLKNYDWSMHYLHPVFLLPLFGLPLVISWSSILQQPKLARTVAIVVGLFALLVPSYYLVGLTPPPQSIRTYVPPFVKFLDDLAAREGLRYGVGGYWQARPVTLLSRTGVRVYSVDNSLRPFLWANNREWYSKALKNRAIKPTIDFVILDDQIAHMTREQAVQVMGEPTREARFENTRVLIFRNAATALKESESELNLVKE
jgi:hypothetical protein